MLNFNDHSSSELLKYLTQKYIQLKHSATSKKLVSSCRTSFTYQHSYAPQRVGHFWRRFCSLPNMFCCFLVLVLESDILQNLRMHIFLQLRYKRIAISKNNLGYTDGGRTM